MSAGIDGLADAEARARIREGLDETLVVEASAGTGKTSELVERILATVCSGRGELSTIAAVTFTEKAAGEMKLRLRGALGAALDACDAEDATRRARLQRALSQLEAARIGTIHGFCGDILRERPIEACVDPRFEVDGEEGHGALLERAFDEHLQRALAGPHPGLRRALRRRDGDRSPLDQLRKALRALTDNRDFDATWPAPSIDREAALADMLSQLEALGALTALASNPRDPLARSLGEIAELAERHRALERVHGGLDHDGLEWGLRQLLRGFHWRRDGRGARYGKELLRSDVVNRRRDLHDALISLVEALEAELAAELREALRPIVAEFETLKAQAGTLDYLDLLIRTRDLLRGHTGARAELQARFTHVLVDEFQDTDPLQAEILLWLCAQPDFDGPMTLSAEAMPPLVPGKLFVVGDPKQAIYRFRRADVVLYERIKRGLVAQGGRVLQLTTSFRAVPDIQSAINVAFAPHMAGSEDGSQASYQPLHPFRPPIEGQAAVVALPVPRPYGGGGRVTKGAVERSTPDAVGAYVDWLIRRGGMRVSEGGALVPLSARHVCLLFRGFRGYDGETTRDYVRALEAREIPHVLVGGRSFHAREEVAALRTALCAVEWPGDRLSVFATLRGPLLSLTDDQLLDFRHHVGPLSPLSRLDDADLTPAQGEVAAALSLLGRLHRGRNRRSAAETLTDLLESTRAHAGIAIWPTGEQALANVLRIGELARAFEQRGSTSFRAFVQHLLDDAERLEAREAPVVEEGTEGVRIMTVHTAKGLEFPVVILCQPKNSRVPTRPSRHVDSERGLWAAPLCGCVPEPLRAHREASLAQDAAEELRIGYVAATRARDLLVVPCIGDGPEPGWVDPLHPALYPPRPQYREPLSQPAGTATDADTVVWAPVATQRRPQDSVAPGLHSPTEGGHRVCWVDPAGLSLDREPRGGLRQDRLLVADEEGRGDAGEEAHAAWQARRAAAIARGEEVALRTRAVTAWAKEEVAEAGPVTLLRTEAPREGRPSGARFGTLVHAVLADAGLHATPEVIGALAAGHGRALGAPGSEVDAAVEAVGHALRHPLMRRAATSADARFEAPMALDLGDGHMAEGSIDLCFVEETDEGSRWVVVDFKSDRVPDPSGPYARQLFLYARALGQATGAPVDAYLLAV